MCHRHIYLTHEEHTHRVHLHFWNPRTPWLVQPRAPFPVPAHQARCPVEEQQNEAVLGAHGAGATHPGFSRHQQTARRSGRRSFTSVSHTAQACSHVPHNTLECNFPGVTGPGTVAPRYSEKPPGRMTTSEAWPRAASGTPYHHLRETDRIRSLQFYSAQR